MLIDYPWYFVLLCLLIGAAYAGALYHFGNSSFSRSLRWGLSVARFVVVSVIAMLLLAPMTRQTVIERQLPHVVLAQDVSQSVALSTDATFNFDDIAAALKGRCRISRESFGSDETTDIGALLERHRGDDVAALVLASDGIHNRGTNPVTVAERLSFPVHCIALGDTTPQRDAVLATLRCNRIAMLGNDFPVEVTVTATLLSGHSTRLLVTDSHGRRLHTEQLLYDSDAFSTTLSFPLSAEEAGLQRYTLSLESVTEESVKSNNTLSFYVDVIDTRQRVAIFANAPHPDLAALKQAIEGHPNFEAEIIMAEDAENGKWKVDGKEYSLAILHNLPSRRHASISYATDFSQLYIIGLQTDLARFNTLHTGLEIDARTSRTNEVTAIFRPDFTLFNLDPDDATVLESMPPLAAPFGMARTSESLQTLLGARLASIDTRQPLVAATAQGEHRRAFLWGEGIWRWRLADYQTHQTHHHVDALVNQLVAFSAMQTNRNRLQVDAERSYGAGEPITLHAQRYNESYQPTNTQDVKLTLKGDSLHSEYLFRREGSGYTLTLPDLREGLYRYVATSDSLTCSGSFAVEMLNIEQQRLVADHGLLATLSSITGGQMFYPNELSTLNSQLSTLKPVIYTHSRYAEMLQLPLVLVLILLLLAAEWVLRKYYGEL